MDLVLKISSDYTAENTHAQIINPDTIAFTEELVNTGTLNFRISLADSQIDEIFEFRKAALYVIEDGTDNYLWSGYIEEIENDFGYANVKCGDEKDFLRNKIILTDKNWTATSVNGMLTDITSEINGRKGVNEGALTFSTDMGSTTVAKQFSAGTSLFDILNEIADALDAEWKVQFNEIIFMHTIGTDRSISGNDYVEFVWNNESPNENNITKFKNKRVGREVATVVFGKASGGTTSTVTGDTSIFGSIERSVSMDDGNVADQTQEYVDKHEVSQLEREFEVDVNEETAKVLHVGDMVKVKVIHGSVLADTDTALKVIEKRMVFENKTPTTTLKLATEKKEITSMDNFLSDLNRRVKRFELY